VTVRVKTVRASSEDWSATVIAIFNSKEASMEFCHLTLKDRGGEYFCFYKVFMLPIAASDVGRSR